MKKLLCTFITLSCINQTIMAMDSETEHFCKKKHTVKEAMKTSEAIEEGIEHEKQISHKKCVYVVL